MGKSKRRKNLHLDDNKNETDPKECKKWSRVGVFSSYEEASNKKKALLETGAGEVKIKRFGQDGLKFQVKTWNAPAPKQNAKKRNKNRVK